MDWKKHRDELLGKKISDLGLDLRGPFLSSCIRRLYRELDAGGIRFHPPCYLSSGWGCPDLVPVIGIPFHLARADLRRLHGEMGYDVEDKKAVTGLLRHEAGHAVCYAYRLHRRRDWQRTFGPFRQAYVDHYVPDPFSGRHVTHVKHYYAQKHPDEDFAEAFAVWLAPGGSWKNDYAGFPVLQKLRYIDGIMREAGKKRPPVRGGERDVPVRSMRFTLFEYYGRTSEEYKRQTAAYVQGVLKKIFASPGRGNGIRAHRFMAEHEKQLVDTVSFWAGLERAKVERIYRSLIRRARAADLRAPRQKSAEIIVNISSLLTFFAHTYVHTRRFAIH